MMNKPAFGGGMMMSQGFGGQMAPGFGHPAEKKPEMAPGFGAPKEDSSEESNENKSLESEEIVQKTPSPKRSAKKKETRPKMPTPEPENEHEDYAEEISSDDHESLDSHHSPELAPESSAAKSSADLEFEQVRQVKERTPVKKVKQKSERKAKAVVSQVLPAKPVVERVTKPIKTVKKKK